MPDDAGVLVPDLVTRFRAAATYAEYEDGLRVYDATPLPDGASADDRAHKMYAAINLQRASRIARTYSPREEIVAAMRALRGPQTWGVLSEVWCGDSAQIIPYLARIAGLRDDVMFRVMARDENPDVMDRYRTNGMRSIPKLIVWDLRGEQLFTWGPRPAGAQAVVDEAIASGIPKEVRRERLHLWYGRDRGRGIEEEIAAHLRAIQ